MGYSQLKKIKHWDLQTTAANQHLKWFINYKVRELKQNRLPVSPCNQGGEPYRAVLDEWHELWQGVDGTPSIEPSAKSALHHFASSSIAPIRTCKPLNSTEKPRILQEKKHRKDCNASSMNKKEIRNAKEPQSILRSSSKRQGTKNPNLQKESWFKHQKIHFGKCWQNRRLDMKSKSLKKSNEEMEQNIDLEKDLRMVLTHRSQIAAPASVWNLGFCNERLKVGFE